MIGLFMFILAEKVEKRIREEKILKMYRRIIPTSKSRSIEKISTRSSSSSAIHTTNRKYIFSYIRTDELLMSRLGCFAFLLLYTPCRCVSGPQTRAEQRICNFYYSVIYTFSFFLPFFFSCEIRFNIIEISGKRLLS